MKAHFIFWQKGPFEEFSAHNNRSWLKKKKKVQLSNQSISDLHFLNSHVSSWETLHNQPLIHSRRIYWARTSYSDKYDVLVVILVEFKKQPLPLRNLGSNWENMIKTEKICRTVNK